MRMRRKHHEEIDRLTKEVQEICKDLPTGKWLQVYNRMGRIRLCAMGITPPPKPEKVYDDLPEATPKQIADRYNARQAVLNALIDGEHVTMMDAKRFGVCDMHTTIARVRETIAKKNLPYTLESKRITFGTEGKVCKEYWITSNNNN